MFDDLCVLPAQSVKEGLRVYIGVAVLVAADPGAEA